MTTEAAAVLKDARQRSGLQQAELAARAGVPQSMISAYENGLREPTLPTLRRLLSAAGFGLALALEQDPSSPAPLSGPVGRRVRRRRAQMRRVLRDRGIVGARIFGSTARGDDRSDSDVDLLIEVPAGMGLLALLSLQHELEDIVGAPVDLVPTDGLKEHLRPAVDTDSIPL